jgi:hypothetical protein
MANGMRAALVAPLCLGLLAGCGGGGDEGDEDRPSRSEMLTLARNLGEASEELDYTDPESLPTTGSAEYDGIMSIETGGSSGAPSRMVGELGLEVNFGRDGNFLSGEAENFVGSNGKELDGSLEISAGGLDRDVDPDSDVPTYVGSIEGTLENPNGAEYRMSGSLEGDFRGEEPDYAVGTVDGILRGPDGNGTFDGDFVAERDRD